MEVRQNVMAGLVRFESLTSGDVFRANNELWLVIITGGDAVDFNATLLLSGRSTFMEPERMVLAIQGAFVEEGAP